VAIEDSHLDIQLDSRATHSLTCGVHVIITGDKGKGDAKLFNSLDIKYELCWNKKWAPGLV
jgi:hypothetical protein